MLSTARHYAGNEITLWSRCYWVVGFAVPNFAAISVGDLQRREEHWVFADLIGKGGHVRTVPVPDWVGSAIQAWLMIRLVLLLHWPPTPGTTRPPVAAPWAEDALQ